MDENQINFDDTRTGIKRLTIEVPLNLWTVAKQNLLEFRECAIFGIKFKLAEKDGGLTYAFPDNILDQRIKKLQRVILDQANKIAKLDGSNEDLESKPIEEDFKGAGI
jgi:hypothetical protein